MLFRTFITCQPNGGGGGGGGGKKVVDFAVLVDNVRSSSCMADSLVNFTS